jgi:hypothetical protein
MAFSPAEFYTLAQGLHLQARQDGAPLRTLISRAYYGALIVARDANPQLRTKGQSGHQRVIDAYMAAGDTLVSDSLRLLRSLREKADYEPDYDLNQSDGLKALSSARRVLQSLKAMPPAA